MSNTNNTNNRNIVSNANSIKNAKVITKSDDSDFYSERKRAQRITFAKFQELLQRNVGKTFTKTFTTYTKSLLRSYITSPNANQDNLREISRFLCRYSMLYKKLLMYYPSMPLFYYNIVQQNDITKSINSSKSIKDFQNVSKNFNTFEFKKNSYEQLYFALRDGFSVNELYDNGEDGKVFMPLDVKYCRIYGKTVDDQWIVYFDASYFDSGDNKIYVEGINGDTSGVWSDQHVQGYREYKDKGRDYQWYRLDPDTTFCLTTCPDDEFYSPLPFFQPLFEALLENIDLQELINNRTELENYVLLVSKIPMVENSEQIDDFSLSLELVQQMQEMIDSVVPELIGTAYSPMEIDKIEFNRSNTTEQNDELAKSINNIFSNAGSSQLVVSGGSSSNSVGLKHAIQNDISTCWVWVEKIQSWYNHYLKNVISDGYEFYFHKETWYNQEEYQSSVKDAATLGGSAMDYLTSLGDTPYSAICKLQFESAIGIKSLMVPLQSSYTQSNSSSDTGGAPQKSEDDLSESGASTRDGDKNAGTKANK